MADDLPLYTIRPRPAGDGFTLEGSLLKYGLWYETAQDAFSYAKERMAPVSGARIEVYGLDGSLYRTVDLPKGPDGVASGMGQG